MNSLAQRVDSGVARFVRPGERESGDRHFLALKQDRILMAVIDGIGHGEEAAAAAEAALAALEECADDSVGAMIRRCHEKLRTTRGVVLSVASIDVARGIMSWIGVGNVQALLFRGLAVGGEQEALLLRGGVVGAQLPTLQEAQLAVRSGDTIVLFTDGVRADFTRHLSLSERPQQAANTILGEFHNGNDDALVLIARLKGIPA